MSKSALGRGLGALLGSGTAPAVPGPAPQPDAVLTADRGPIRLIAIKRIQPSRLQPRKTFAPEQLQELAESIREQGLLQPLIVRPSGADYELIAGERRWRAVQTLGWTEVPVLIRPASDHAVLEMMLVENLQREDLNPIEEALGYEQLITQFQLRQEDVAARVGKNRATVANALRLLKLASEIQVWIRQGQLSAGHAKAILGLSQPTDQKRAAERIQKLGLSVRATEELVAQWESIREARSEPDGSHIKAIPAKDMHVADLENQLQQRLGTRVQMRYRKGKGALVIHFFSDEELERLLQIFSVKVG